MAMQWHAEKGCLFHATAVWLGDLRESPGTDYNGKMSLPTSETEG